MSTRISPQDYFRQNQTPHQVEKKVEYIPQPQIQYVPYQVEITQIPNWVPILLGIALMGAFAIALYAIHKSK
jgi:hypothetical protein